MFIYRSIEDKLRQFYLQFQYIHNAKNDSALCDQVNGSRSNGSIVGIRSRILHAVAALGTRGAGTAACADTAGD